MIGRENQKENDLFFTCSRIDYIARKTKNKRIDDYNSSFYYDAPQNILNAYIYGEIE